MNVIFKPIETLACLDIWRLTPLASTCIEYMDMRPIDKPRHRLVRRSVLLDGMSRQEFGKIHSGFDQYQARQNPASYLSA